ILLLFIASKALSAPTDAVPVTETFEKKTCNPDNELKFHLINVIVGIRRMFEFQDVNPTGTTRNVGYDVDVETPDTSIEEGSGIIDEDEKTTTPCKAAES
ncbi:hypothetical protein PENTCL1PPCAC_18773, partial [Pristionchus entomophagus]